MLDNVIVALSRHQQTDMKFRYLLPLIFIQYARIRINSKRPSTHKYSRQYSKAEIIERFIVSSLIKYFLFVKRVNS